MEFYGQLDQSKGTVPDCAARNFAFGDRAVCDYPQISGLIKNGKNGDFIDSFDHLYRHCHAVCPDCINWAEHGLSLPD